MSRREATAQAQDRGSRSDEGEALLVSEPADALAPPPRRVRVLILANVFSAALYVSWWLVPGRVGTPALFWALAGAEAFSLLHLGGLWWTVWSTRLERPPTRRRDLSIDVFIPTHGEPLDILETTITAAIAMRHPHRTIVLDDKRDPRVRLLADRLGAEYITRSDNVGAKAGNLNNALRQTDGALIAMFDADHAPRKDFLVRLLGYFSDETVGFVQTPQYYRNAPTNPIARGAFNQQAIFYGPICRGKSGLDAAFCCGTNVIFRRAALEEVGGFDQKSVVEDLVTSMRIHRKGWRSIYYPRVLAEGLGPSTIDGFARQQFRWARGSVGALMSGEPFRRGYTAAQRAQYLLATTFYLIGLVTAVYVTLPIFYAFGGLSAFSTTSSSFVFFYAPYLALSLATIRWGLGRNLHLEHLRFTFGSFPAYLGASVAAILHLPARFHTTRDSAAKRRRVSPAFIVTLLALCANVAAIIGALILQPFNPRTVTTVSWAAMNVMLLSGISALTLRALLRREPVEEQAPAPVLTGAPVLPDRALREAPRPRPAWRGIAATIAVLTAAGFILRLALIDSQSLRLDESLSLQQSSRSLPTLWNYLVSSNVHVPLYHTMLHGWLQFSGSSEIALRLPSVILGTGVIPLLYLVARRIVGTRAAVVAAAIGAGSPFLVWHSDEARMYPLLLFAALTSTLLFLRAVERPTVLRWASYAIVLGITFYAHYFALLLPPVHLLYLIIYRPKRRAVLSWFGAVTVSGLLFAPWVVALYLTRIQAEGFASISSGVRLEQPEYTLFGLLYGFVAFFAVFFVGYHGVGVLSIITGVLGGMWPLAIFRGGTRGQAGVSRKPFAFLLGWIIVAVGVVFAMNVVLPGLLVQKYLILATPPLYLLAARAAERTVGASRGRVAILFALLAATAIVQNAEPMNPLHEDFRQASSIIRTTGTAGETVFVLPVYNATPFIYYHGSFEVRPMLSPAETPLMAVGALERFAAEHRGARFWTVSMYSENADPSGLVRRYVTRSFDRLARYRLGSRMEIARYQVPSVS